jgi:hypothetical protein
VGCERAAAGEEARPRGPRASGRARCGAGAGEEARDQDAGRQEPSGGCSLGWGWTKDVGR